MNTVNKQDIMENILVNKIMFLYRKFIKINIRKPRKYTRMFLNRNIPINTNIEMIILKTTTRIPVPNVLLPANTELRPTNKSISKPKSTLPSKRNSKTTSTIVMKRSGFLMRRKRWSSRRISVIISLI